MARTRPSLRSSPRALGRFDLDSFPSGFELTLDGGAAEHLATVTTGSSRALFDVSENRGLTLRGIRFTACSQQ